MTRQALRLIVGLLMAAAATGAAAAAPVDVQAATPARMLDVPYLPQSEDLCGGAAAAMVMRYWGARDLYADAFAPLVDHSAGGIRTDALAADLRRRGWTALVESGDLQAVEGQIAQGRPVIALIEDRPGRFHYVVVVSVAAGRVIVQDPARAPLRNIALDRFLRAWGASERWMLVLLPPDGFSAATPVSDGDSLAAPPPPQMCVAMVTQGVADANAGNRAAAGDALTRAEVACPNSSAPLRELAGLEAAAGNWAAARDRAARAVSIDASDQYAWNLLATARFVEHDDLGALSAWNHAGQPRVDLLTVQGLSRTRYRIASDATGLTPRDVLTPGSLLLAQRRLQDVPAFASARVSYRPESGGRAVVDAAVVERDLFPRTYAALGAIAVEAAVNRFVSTTVASPTGGGEVVTVTGRWWQHRPGAWLTFAAPAPAAIGGVWRVDASRETQAFGEDALEQTRAHAGLAYGKWVTARARIEGNGGVDSWSNGGRGATFGVVAQFWPEMNRLALDVAGTAWTAAAPFGRFDGGVRWRSTAASSGHVWLARGALQIATDAAPEFVWPGADTGPARDVLLRAHPLLHDGVITGGVFGRELVAGSAEWRRWSRLPTWLVQIAPAVFVDTARATRGLATTDDRTHVDVGAGVRFSMAGMGVLRIDLAHGLRDGATALSVGIER